MTISWQPFRESLRTTLLRTIAIAVVAGGIVSLSSRGRIQWPLATLLLLWFSFGGHWVELWYLNWLRPRLSPARRVQIAARVATWFIAGNGMAIGMALTARGITGAWRTRLFPWWLTGVVFIGVELIAHLVLQLRRQPSCYNGRG